MHGGSERAKSTRFGRSESRAMQFPTPEIYYPRALECVAVLQQSACCTGAKQIFPALDNSKVCLFMWTEERRVPLS